MDEGEKKKKKRKEKAAVRGRQQKSQHISQPSPTGPWDGEQMGQQQQGLESLKHIQSRESRGSRRCGDPGCWWGAGGAGKEALARRCA